MADTSGQKSESTYKVWTGHMLEKNVRTTVVLRLSDGLTDGDGVRDGHCASNSSSSSSSSGLDKEKTGWRSSAALEPTSAGSPTNPCRPSSPAARCSPANSSFALHCHRSQSEVLEELLQPLYSVRLQIALVALVVAVVMMVVRLVLVSGLNHTVYHHAGIVVFEHAVVEVVFFIVRSAEGDGTHRSHYEQEEQNLLHVVVICKRPRE